MRPTVWSSASYGSARVPLTCLGRDVSCPLRSGETATGQRRSLCDFLAKRGFYLPMPNCSKFVGVRDEQATLKFFYFHPYNME